MAIGRKVLLLYLPILATLALSVVFFLAPRGSTVYRKSAANVRHLLELKEGVKWQDIHYGPKPGSIYPYLVYIYNLTQLAPVHHALNVTLDRAIFNSINDLDYVTSDPAMAGWFLVLLGDSTQEVVSHNPSGMSVFESLSYWDGGISHVIVSLDTNPAARDLSEIVNTGRSIFAQPVKGKTGERADTDIVIPYTTLTRHQDLLPLLTPVRRKHLFTFHGRPDKQTLEFNKFCKYFGGIFCPSPKEGLHEVAMNIPHPGSDVILMYTCSGTFIPSPYSEWFICDDGHERRRTLSSSLFTLIPVPHDPGVMSTVTFQRRLSEALKYGSIPVIIGESKSLPYSEVLDWRRACVYLPSHLSRTNTINLLSGYSDAAILEMRHQGRHLWATYFSSPRAIVEMTLLILRVRHQVIHPPAPSHNHNSTLEEKRRSSQFTVFSRNGYPTAVLHRPGDVFHSYSSTPARDDRRILGGDSSDHVQYQSGPWKYEGEQINVIIDAKSYPPEVSVACISQLSIEKTVFYILNTNPYKLQYKAPESFQVIPVKGRSVNNVFTPYDVIKGDTIVIIRDQERVFTDDLLLRGLRQWRNNKDKVVLFYTRPWRTRKSRKTGECAFLYHQPDAILIHKYYLHLYLNTVPQPIRHVIHNNEECADLFITLFVAHVTGKLPLQVFGRDDSPCNHDNCRNKRTSMSKKIPELCSDIFLRHYGYMPACA